MSVVAFPPNGARRVALTALVVIAACTDGNPVANSPARSAAPSAPTLSFNHGGPCPTAVSAADSSCLQQDVNARLSSGVPLAARVTPGTFSQVVNGPLTIAQIGFVSGFQQFVTQQALGTVDVFSETQVAAGALTAEAYDVIVLGRTFQNLPPGFRLAIEAEMAAGAGLLTEWNAGAFVWNAFGPSSQYYLFRENDGTLFDWHNGAVDRGDCQWTANCASTPFTITNAVHPVTSGLPAQFTVPAMEFCYRVSNADPGLAVLATVPDLVGGGTKPVMLAGARGTARVLYFLCDWQDNGLGSAILRTWLANALAWVAEPENNAPVADAGGPYTDNEGSAVSFDGTGSSDADGDILTYSWDFGDGSPAAAGDSPSHTYADNGSYTVTVTVSDGNGGTSSATTTATIANVAPALGALAVPPTPLALVNGGAVASVSASYTDPGTADTHTASLSCDGGSAGSVTAGNGAAGGTCTFTAAGVYTVTLTVTDDDGGTDSETASSYVVVYDASAGFVTGGGWIDSPAGAYPSDPTLTGKATFGFVSRYQKGATVPSGNTEFHFQAASFTFRSASYQWLVIAGARAQYKGVGTVSGRTGSFGFLLTAIDGAVAGGGGVDKFRLKVWDSATGVVVYDNQLGQFEDSGAATALGGGSIVIHAK